MARQTAAIPEPTVSARLLAALAAYVEPKGLRFNDLLHCHGIADATVDDLEAQVPLNSVAALFETVARRLGDPAFGLHYAEASPPGLLGAFAYAVLNAKNNRQAVQAIARYAPLVVSSLEVQFRNEKEVGTLQWRYSGRGVAPKLQLSSFMMATFILLLRRNITPRWSPERVDLPFRDGPHRSEMLRLVGPGLRFNETTHRIVFREGVLDSSRLAADADLLDVARHLGDLMLISRRGRMDLIAQVRGEIADQLGVAPARLETVAQELRLSPRSLQRKLADHGVSFSKLVSETRRQTAARLLGDTDLSMSDIALMLGLSQSSAFTRATQRWFGMSPRRVRMQLRAEWRGSGAKEQCFFL